MTIWPLSDQRPPRSLSSSKPCWQPARRPPSTYKGTTFYDGRGRMKVDARVRVTSISSVQNAGESTPCKRVIFGEVRDNTTGPVEVASALELIAHGPELDDLKIDRVYSLVI